jgi:Plasmid pRiA4b ORF-3-like protein
VDNAASRDDFHEAARLACECTVLRSAAALAHWIGTAERPVTSAQVLRKADAAAAGAAIGVRVPPKIRSAADLPELHGPWSAAVAMGLLQISEGKVSSGPALEGWPPGDAAVLDAWFAGLRAVCQTLADPWQEDGVTGMLAFALALLTVLEDEEAPTSGELWRAVLEESGDLCDTYDLDLVPFAAMRRTGPAGGSQLGGMVALLAGFGAVTGGADRPVITPLGRWAVRRLADALPRPAAPELPAAELIEEVAEHDDPVQRLKAASRWLEQHQPREILEAAESMSPRLRSMAADLVMMLGSDAIPAWREFSKTPNVGPHARYALYVYDQEPEPSERELNWLAGESAAAALDAKGPDEALSVLWESVPGADLTGRLAVVREAGHPAAGELAGALTEFTASGRPRSIDLGLQLKVTLKHASPAIWRSVRLPVTATLGDLHWVIQILFGWDGDHLHAFRMDGRAYSDPDFSLDNTADEDDIRVRDACPPGVKVGYEYDFGASWQHEITAQQAFTLDPGQEYPVCVAYQGDSPVEYPSEEDPQEPAPFSLTDVNRMLAALTR